MGNAIGKCLMSQNVEVVAWNRSPDKTKTLVDAGAAAVNTIAELFDQVDTVFMMVVGDENMNTATGLLKQVGKGLKDKILVQWTSHEPSSADAQAAYVESQGGHWVGGAMMATPDGVCSEHGLFFLSGANQAVFDNLNQIASSLGGLHYYGPKPGLGSLYDIAVLNTLMFGAFGHMLALPIVELGGGDIDVYDGLMKMLSPLLLVDIASTSTTIYKSNDYNPVRKTMPLDSFIPALRMWRRYFEKIGMRTELLDVMDRWYSDLKKKHPELQKEDVTIIAKYANLNGPINDTNEL